MTDTATRPMFAPSDGDLNHWSTDGHGHDLGELNGALGRALVYYDAAYDRVPDTTVYHEEWMGQAEGAWYVCDTEGRIMAEEGWVEPGTIRPITMATLVPEPDPEPEPEEAAEQPIERTWGDVLATRASLYAAADGQGSIETGRWDDCANLHQLAAPFGRVCSAADLARRGDIGDDVAQANLREALLTVAAVAAAWVEAIDRA
jgi:hypothetical protein